MNTEHVPMQDLKLGMTVLVHNIGIPNLVDCIKIRELSLEGDDVVINAGEITSSKSNLISILVEEN